MTDISKCNDDNCPSRNTCKRFLIEPSEYQVYSNFHREENDAWCEVYIYQERGK